MEQGVFYESKVKDAYVKALTPPSVNSYLFSSNPTIHVYSKALAAYKKSGWAEYGTIVGDLEDCEIITTSINAPEGTFRQDSSDGAIYNLQGVQIAEPQPGTIYIQNGKKVIK